MRGSKKVKKPSAESYPRTVIFYNKRDAETYDRFLSVALQRKSTIEAEILAVAKDKLENEYRRERPAATFAEIKKLCLEEFGKAPSRFVMWYNRETNWTQGREYFVVPCQKQKAYYYHTEFVMQYLREHTEWRTPKEIKKKGDGIDRTTYATPIQNPYPNYY